MLRKLSFIFTLCFSLFIFSGASAEDLPLSSSLESHIFEQPVKVELIHEAQSIKPGQPFWVAIRFNLDEKWHSYWKNPGDSGMPTTIEWLLPEGFTAGPLQWPVPSKFEIESMLGYGYENEHYVLVQIIPPEEAIDHEAIDIRASLEWLVCSDSECLPGMGEVSASLPMTGRSPEPHPSFSPMIAMARDKLPKDGRGQLQAYRTESSIELAVAESGVIPFSADFYPEEPSSIDDRSVPLVSRDNDSGDYLITLKVSDDREERLSILKGILVLRGEDGSNSSIDVNLPIDEKPSKRHVISMSESTDVPVTTKEEGSLFLFYLATAFVGGLILNLMPCVLPVISLKVLSFVKMAGEERSRIMKHGLAFFFGILTSFWLLAGALLILQAYGNAVGWGFQLQDPLFVALMAIVIFIFSLSMFGLFEVGAFFASWAGSAASKKAQAHRESLTASFFSGALATAVATPCTGPFLGPAVGFAVAQPPLLALMIFTSLGIGMAAPYLLLASFPQLLRFVPKPGNWMITFKEVTGFILMATVIWLLWVFNAQTGSMGLFFLFGALFLISVACWIYGKWCTPLKKRSTRLIAITVTAFIFAAGGNLVWKATSPAMIEQASSTSAIADSWEPFSRQRLDELLAAGTPVFVDFTARWCLICQANHLVLASNEVTETFNSQGVVKMKADWTKRDAEITKELNRYGRNSVPLYLLYHEANQPAKILPQVLTPAAVISEIKSTKAIETAAK